MAGNTDDRPTSGTDPSLMEGLRGAAHLYDTVRRLTTGRDPQMRNHLDSLDEVTLADVVHGAETVASAEAASSQPPEPHVDTRDTETGKIVVVDTSGTPVKPDRLMAGPLGDPDGTEGYHDSDGRQVVRITDPEATWFQNVHLHPGHVVAEINQNAKDDVAEFEIVYEEPPTAAEMDAAPAGSDEGREDGQEAGDTARTTSAGADATSGDMRTPEEVRAATTDEAPTLNEFLDENPWAEQMLGEDTANQLRMLAGGTRMDELPDMAESMMGDLPAGLDLGAAGGEVGDVDDVEGPFGEMLGEIDEDAIRDLADADDAATKEELIRELNDDADEDADGE